MQERRPTRRARRRGRKRIAFSIVAVCLVVGAHYQLEALENTSMAALENNSAAQKIGARAARFAARSESGADGQSADGTRPGTRGGFKIIRQADRVSLPGPAAAGIAMQLSGNAALQARFRRLQQETASALTAASDEGRDLSALRTPLPTVISERVPGR